MISSFEDLTAGMELTEQEPTQEQFRHQNCTVLSSVCNGSWKEGGIGMGCHGRGKLHGSIGLSVYYEPDPERDSDKVETFSKELRN